MRSSEGKRGYVSVVTGLMLYEIESLETLRDLMEPSRLSHPASISAVRPASELLSVSVGVYRFIPVNGMEVLRRLI